METILNFPELLRMIDERSAAFRAAVASAPSLDVPVPTCPGWTLFDLAQHLGMGRRKAAAIVAAGPADAPPATSAWDDGKGAPRDREALVAWLTDSIEQLASTLHEAGPDRGCWTWWGDSQSPQTSGAVARHQVQEVAVHTYDAQLTLGAPQPLPDDVALDGVEEFQFTCCATDVAWPHEPAVIDYHASEGRSLRVRLDRDGARVTRLHTSAASEDPDPADASAWGTANDLVLAFYGRIPLNSLKLEGDRRIFDQIVAWDPGA
ncbi:maleylpyruvate isomerase N-terminal domain-containing protein [Krasilnikovia sp. M28-CT-15]|uniref:maleylpyruvate isomerase N-terminal domain-containing protein n=1 Tax=Krasilnikovia sp. M28-CT-15 TaxID=3373540 RepID=UPI0038775D13